MEVFKIKQSSCINYALTFILGMVAVYVVTAKFLIYNKSTQGILVIFSLVILYYLTKFTATVLTIWTFRDNEIQVNWTQPFLLHKSRPELTINWDEIKAYKFGNGKTFDTFKLELKNGTILKYWHDNFITRDDYEKFVGYFVLRVERHNAQELSISNMKASSQNDNNPENPSLESLNTNPQENDKIVIVGGVAYSDLKIVVKGFCDMYKKEGCQILPRMTKLTERDFSITFPFDIDFQRFCYFVNYIKYPMEVKWNAIITGWTTTHIGDTWITDRSLNKNVMLFITDDDTEYDNVYMTTSDNFGYKLGFAKGQEKQLLETPKKLYIEPKIGFSDLSDKEFEDLN